MSFSFIDIRQEMKSGVVYSDSHIHTQKYDITFTYTRSCVKPPRVNV